MNQNDVELIKVIVRDDLNRFKRLTDRRGSDIDQLLRLDYDSISDVIDYANGNYMADDMNATTLWYAATFGSINILKYAIEQGANLDFVEKAEPVLYRSLYSYEITKLLLEAGADPNIDVEYTNPLFGAVELGDVKIFDLLLDHEADFTIEDPDGNNIISRSVGSVLRDRWHPNRYWADKLDDDERVLHHILSNSKIYYTLDRSSSREEARKYGDISLMSILDIQSLELISYGSIISSSIDISALPKSFSTF